MATVFMVFAMLFLGSLLFFCCFYLFASQQQLVHWFTGLNPCFYKNATWGNDFFTPAVKSIGNRYCLLAIAIILPSLYFLVRRFSKRTARTIQVSFEITDLLLSGLIIALTAALWNWGNHLALPAPDEVFSAQNAASIHPFQAIAYYMLPNNHLLFNFLNNTLFHAADDKIITGRFISYAAYAATLSALFFWFKNRFNNRWLAIIACMTMALQFQIWGFSFQARGYELYLLAEWGMVISLFAWISSENGKWLYINTICCAAGYFCMPSFLYFHLAQMVFLGIYQITYKQKGLLIWKFQLATLALTFLLYLPVLCFSGLSSISENNYVQPMGAYLHTGRWPYAVWMFQNIGPLLTHIFSDYNWNNIPVSLLLYFAPIALLFCGTNRYFRLLGIFYCSIWITFFIVSIGMKRLPFERNLIGHHSVTLAGVLILFFWLATILANIVRNKPVAWIAFSLLSSGMALHFFNTNQSYLKETLYEFNVNALYKEKSEWLDIIPAGSKAAFSDEEFYTYYICKKKGCQVSKCAEGGETFYVKQVFEKIHDSDKYVLSKKFYGNEIWKLK